MPTAIASPSIATAFPDEPLLTAEEFARLPESLDGSREELVRGKVVTMPMPQFRHGMIQANVTFVLKLFVKSGRLGQVVTETGLVTERGSDTVRGPDVAFWSVNRLPLDTKVEVYPDIAADLCVEILSPGERSKRLPQKLREYFACGVRLVWVLDPDARTVTIYRNPSDGRILREDATLTGEDVLPGFECRVSELFDA